jgi:Domain of unknown function DUF11
MLAFAGAAATGRAANSGPNVSLSVTGAPGSVSLGHYVAYTATISNRDTNNVTHLALTAPAASSTSPFPLAYVSATPSRGSCSTPPALPLSCSFGPLASGASVSVTFVFRAPAALPASGAAVSFAAQISFDEGPNDQNSSHSDTKLASAATTLGAVGDDFVTGFVPFALGDDLETAGALTGPSNGNPQKTGLAVAALAASALGATGSIQEISHPAADTTSDCQAGFSCFGQTSVVTLPGSFSPPLQLSFRFDASELPSGMTQKKLRMFKNGALVPLCTTPGVLSPGPTCQSSTTSFDDKDLGALLLSSTNGSYRP